MTSREQHVSITSEYQANSELTPNPLKPDEIRVLNWNIAKGSRRGWQQDLRSLSHDKQIVMIQEARLGPELTEAIDPTHHFSFSQGYSTAIQTTGVLTAAAARPTSHHRYKTAEPLIRTPKALLVTEYRLDGGHGSLLVANIHAVNFSLGMRAFSHQLLNLHRILKNHHGPLILSGDFNTWHRRRVDYLDQMIRDLHLSSIDYDADHRVRWFGHHIDHIFFRGLELCSAATHSVRSSDHNPMEAVFRLW
jgi:endonuclease/exonuclease/phosphatase (EEP) superfamily protein YafD